MTKPAAVLALIPLLTLVHLPGAARAADDHVTREVEERFGAPQARSEGLCNAPDSREQVRCLRWQYDSGSQHAVFYFDPDTWRLLESYTWDDAGHQATNTSEQVRSLLDSARSANDP